MKRLLPLLLLLAWIPAHACTTPYTCGTPQEAPSAGVTNPAVTVTGVHTGDTLVAIMVMGNGVADSGVSSDVSGALTRAGSCTMAGPIGAAGSIVVYAKTNATAGTNVVTGTVDVAFGVYLTSFWVSGSSTVDTAVCDSSLFPTLGPGNEVTLAGGPITTTQGGDCVIFFTYDVTGMATMSAGTSPNAFTAISGFANGTGGGDYTFGESFVQPVAGTINPTATPTTSDGWGLVAIALKVSGSPPPPPPPPANAGRMFLAL